MHHPLHKRGTFIGPKRCLEPHSCMHCAAIIPSHSRDYSNHLSPGWACALYGMIGTLHVFSKHWHDLSDTVSQAITEPSPPRKQTNKKKRIDGELNPSTLSQFSMHPFRRWYVVIKLRSKASLASRTVPCGPRGRLGWQRMRYLDRMRFIRKWQALPFWQGKPGLGCVKNHQTIKKVSLLH